MNKGKLIYRQLRKILDSLISLDKPYAVDYRWMRIGENGNIETFTQDDIEYIYSFNI